MATFITPKEAKCHQQPPQARLCSRASEFGISASAYVAEMIRERVSVRELSESDRKWVSDRLKTNCHRRAKADAKTAAGYYRGKRKRPGLPRKPGPKKSI